jgi:cell division protein FtsL
MSGRDTTTTTTAIAGPRTRRGAGAGAFLLALVTVGALAHVGVRLKGLEVAYDLGRERRRAAQLEERRRRLQIEIGMLKDPSRVVPLAREKLKMGPPDPQAIRPLAALERAGDAAAGAARAPAPVAKTVAKTVAKKGAGR